MENTKHACMLPKPLKHSDLPPTAPCWQHFKARLRQMVLPCEWHHGSAVFIRSRKSLELERERQQKSGRWYVWHPYSPVKFYWDCLVMLSNMFAIFYAPWQVFLHCPNPADPVMLATDFLAFCDILVLFISGYHDEDDKIVVLEPSKIAVHYLKGTFVLDIIAVLPLQLYQPFDNCMYPTHTMFYPIKLLRFVQNRKKYEEFIEQLELSYYSTVLLTVTMWLVYFFHWMTYVHFQVPAFCAHFFPAVSKDESQVGGTNLNDGMDPAQEAVWLKRFKVDAARTLFEKYVTNLYLVCGICIGAGYYSPVNHHVWPEMILNSFTGIVGIIFLTYCFMAVVRLSLYTNHQKLSYDSRLKDLETYMIAKRLPKSLQQKIKLYVNYKFCDSYLNEVSILNTINEQIKQDINMFACKRLVMNVQMFKDMPVSVINAIIFSLRQETLVPGQVILKCRQPSSNMYFISYGTVSVMDEAGKELMHLNDGAYFGEAAMVRPNTPTSVTIIALEITEIFLLKSDDFHTCIQPYPHLQRRVEERAHLRSRHRGISRKK